nr:reverse transcriptase domain-containing protein [Tanacetum cinerariifolium]
MDECLALADLGASINLMPLSVWEGLSLPELTPTCMTLELADRSVSKPIGITKDVSVKVGVFHFPADFVVVDFEPDPQGPLILGRCFLKTGRALIDVHKGELTLRIGNEAITYNLDQTSRYSANYNQMTANKIDVIDMACEEYSQEVLGFSNVITSGNPTPYDDPIVSTTSPTPTLFGDSDFLLFEEANAFLGLEDDPNSLKFNPFYYDPEGDILLLETILNSEPLPPLPNHEQYMPSFNKELKVYEAKTIKSYVDEPHEVELKDLPPHLEYAFLEGDNKLAVIIAKELGDEEKSTLIKVLKSHKRAIAWKLSDIQGINPEFYTHKILMEEDYKPVVQHQRRVNPKIHDVIKKEVEKLLDAGLIYPISNSPWVSPVKENQEKDKNRIKTGQKQEACRSQEKIKAVAVERGRKTKKTKIEWSKTHTQCSSCGTLYIRDCCCSKGNVEDKILVPKPPKNYARCGHPVNGPYCQGCTLLREKLEEDLVTYFQDFQNAFESFDYSTNAVNAPREPFVVKQDHGVNPSHIDEYCCKCGDTLDGIFCQQYTCKSCGKGAHIGYNCPPKVPIISNPEPCNQTMNNELPQTLSGFDPTCYSDKENSVPCVSKPNFVDESSNIFNPPSQPPIYYCEFCGSNAQYVHYCTPQAPFQEDKRIKEEQAANAQYWKILACCDDDDDYNSAITPVLSIEETKNSLSIEDEHLDIILAMKSDEVIKSSVENLVPILSKFEGIPDTMCDVHLVNNPTPLEAKDHFEIVINSNDDISSSDDDYLYNENIEYVEATPHDSELVSLEATEIVIPEVEEIEDDHLREKFGSTTTHSDISLPDYEAFYFDDDHIEEISSGSTTTHSDVSLSEYYSFIFDLVNDQFPPTDRSDFTHEEFADEFAHIISPPEYVCFYFRNLPDSGELISILNSRIRENLSTTCVNLTVEDDHFPLLAYVVWIFLAYLTYPVIPPYLYSFGNEDTIFDPGIIINRFCSFKPGLSNRCGTFKKLNTHRSYLNESPMEMLFSTFSLMEQ